MTIVFLACLTSVVTNGVWATEYFRTSNKTRKSFDKIFYQQSLRTLKEVINETNSELVICLPWELKTKGNWLLINELVKFGFKEESLTLIEIENNDVEKTVLNYLKNKKETINYVIVDNQTLNYKKLKDKVVEINVKDGITEDHYNEVLNKLKKE